MKHHKVITTDGKPWMGESSLTRRRLRGLISICYQNCLRSEPIHYQDEDYLWLLLIPSDCRCRTDFITADVNGWVLKISSLFRGLIIVCYQHYLEIQDLPISWGRLHFRPLLILLEFTRRCRTDCITAVNGESWGYQVCFEDLSSYAIKTTLRSRIFHGQDEVYLWPLLMSS